MCLFRFGQLHKRRTHSQSHSCYVQQHYVQQRSISLLMEHCSRSPLHCDLAAKVAHVGRFAGAARAHRQPNGPARPADARAWARWPSVAFNLPTCGSAGSHAKGAMPHLWKLLRPTVALPASVSESSMVGSGASSRYETHWLLQWPLLTSIHSLGVHLHRLQQTHNVPSSLQPTKGTVLDMAQTFPWHRL